ncbi:MAG: glycosyltransferase family 2 protein [Anaerolineae bacterium]|nr:glycosyltransferase family 2 protein [Anaerolineae bacterium]
MTTLSVVIPAYNEEGGIAEIAHRVLSIRESLKEVGVNNLELLVVDDGSKDRTVEIAGSIEGVTLIQHPQNKGYGGALKTGFSQATGELIAFLDADGTYPPEYFPQLCQEALNGADLVVGSRRGGAESHMPPMRKLGNFIWSNLLSILGNQHVQDPASGMRVFKSEILDQVYPLPDGLNLTPVMSTRAIHEGLKIKEIPIPYSERVGRSKLSVVHDGSLFLQSIVWTALTYNPVRPLGLIGVTLVGVSLLVVVGLVLARLSGVTSLGAWGVAAIYTALVTAVSGVSIFALGVTFNYLVSIFHKKPMRQGLFKKPVFKKPLNRHFGWMGLAGIVVGLLVGLVSLALTTSDNWPIERLWFYLLFGAMSFLVGGQLFIYWMLLQVLEELSKREIEVARDLQGYGPE